MVNAAGDTANAAAEYDVVEVDLKQAFKNLIRFACKDIVKSHPSAACLSSLLNRIAAVIGGAETEDREVEEVCDS